MSPLEHVPWEHLLSDRLRDAATNIGGDELVWKRAEAIEVAEWIQAVGRHISGVDTFIIRDGEIIPVTFDWNEAYAGQDDQRFPASPVDFIRRFSWDIIPQEEESDPYFGFSTH